mgnify:CR=1 FL=1
MGNRSGRKNRHEGNSGQDGQKKIAVIDFETDPFLYGRVPAPFAAGFYDGERYIHTWGPNCADELVRVLDTFTEPMIVYAHNGGKFDFHFLMKYISNPIKIIGSRIVSAKIGIHELRDSYAAVPVPLAAYEKTTIDYDKFEVENREAHKTEILNYLKDDCIFLHSLISGFIERFGTQLTIGGASIKQLRAMHPFDLQRESHDRRFRQFYFGGRVQCFEYGVLKRKVKIYDVNSMYPAVMRNAIHPTGKEYITVRDSIMDKHGRIVGISNAPFYFARVRATIAGGGLPVRTKKGLDFHAKQGEFWTTSHEVKVLISRGLIKVEKVIEAHAPYETISFGDFVDKFSEEKINAKKRGDKAAELFAKLILNSSYGKTAQNSENYRDYCIMRGEIPAELEYQLDADHGEFQIWSKPVTRHSYIDVAIGASITSASRAVLLEGLLSVKNPVYCDTDSIICESPGNLDIDATRLGAWKFEGEGDRIALAGKKLYAVFNGTEEVKSASKGAVLNALEIERIAMGEQIQWKNMAPTFSLLNPPSFIDRKIQSVFT